MQRTQTQLDARLTQQIAAMVQVMKFMVKPGDVKTRFTSPDHLVLPRLKPQPMPIRTRQLALLENPGAGGIPLAQLLGLFNNGEPISQLWEDKVGGRVL